MKKLSRTDAQAQARRLQACPALAPQSDEGRKEIVDCLLRNCRDIEHASRTMTAVLDNCADPRNLVAEIKGAAIDTMHSGETLPDGCSECSLGPDPTTGKPRWGSHVAGERNGYSCAVRCTCARGQWLSRRDRERELGRSEAGESQTIRHGDFTPSSDVARRAAGDFDE